jgi:hypothetical protein
MMNAVLKCQKGANGWREIDAAPILPSVRLCILTLNTAFYRLLPDCKKRKTRVAAWPKPVETGRLAPLSGQVPKNMQNLYHECLA